MKSHFCVSFFEKLCLVINITEFKLIKEIHINMEFSQIIFQTRKHCGSWKVTETLYNWFFWFNSFYSHGFEMNVLITGNGKYQKDLKRSCLVVQFYEFVKYIPYTNFASLPKTKRIDKQRVSVTFVCWHTINYWLVLVIVVTFVSKLWDTLWNVQMFISRTTCSFFFNLLTFEIWLLIFPCSFYTFPGELVSKIWY